MSQEAPVAKKDVRVKFPIDVQFFAACSNSEMDEIEKLLSGGIDINVVNVDGLTVLHQACIDNDYDLAQFLLKKGSDVNAQDNEGWTPLHACAACPYPELAKLLLDNGASAGIVSLDTELPVDVAVGEDMICILNDAMKKQHVDASVARKAEEQRMLEDSKTWLETGIYPTVTESRTGATALHVAAAKGYSGVVELLLKLPGIDVDVVDNDGWTPLHAAAHWAKERPLRLLAGAGANFDKRTLTDQSIFEVADCSITMLLRQLRETQRLERNNAQPDPIPIQAPIIETPASIKSSETTDEPTVPSRRKSDETDMPDDAHEAKKPHRDDTENDPESRLKNGLVQLDRVPTQKNSSDASTAALLVSPPASNSTEPAATKVGSVSDPLFAPKGDVAAISELGKPANVVPTSGDAETPPVDSSAGTAVPDTTNALNHAASSNTESVDHVKIVSKPTPSQASPIEAAKSKTEDSKVASVPSAAPSLAFKASTSPEPNAATPTIQQARRLFANSFNSVMSSSRPIRNDAVIKRVSAVLAPVKGDETEAQRSSKARHVRSTRRSTQGIANDILEDARQMSANHLAMANEKTGPAATVDDTSCRVPEKKPIAQQKSDVTQKELISAQPTVRGPSRSMNSWATPDRATVQFSKTDMECASVAAPSSTSTAPAAAAAKSSAPFSTGTVYRSRRTRDSAPTGVVKTSDVLAAGQLEQPSQSASKPEKSSLIVRPTSRFLHSAALNSDQTNSDRPSLSPNRQYRPATPSNGSPSSVRTVNSTSERQQSAPDRYTWRDKVDYRRLYEEERNEKERLLRILEKMTCDIAMLQSELVRLKSLQDAGHSESSPDSSSASEIERLRQENAKMSDENKSLVRVISKLSSRS